MSDTSTLTANTDTSDADMFAAAMAADEGRETPASPTVATSITTETPTAASSDTDESVNQAAVDADKAPAKPTEKPTEQKPAAPEKPETPFTKAAKERERQQSLLKNFEADKAAFREEKAKIAQDMDALRREIAELRKPPATPTETKDEHGHTSATYEQVAKRYEEEGNYDMANMARQKAASLKQPAPTAPSGAAAASATAGNEAWKSPEFQQQWQQHAAALVQAEPALGNPEHPVFKAVGQLVNQSPFAPFFKARPDGIRAAFEVATLQIEAAAAADLRKQVETTQAEIKRLTALTSPRGSLPTGQHAQPKSLAEMSSDEADAFVRNLAASADRGET
jgi:hypothetical protein